MRAATTGTLHPARARPRLSIAERLRRATADIWHHRWLYLLLLPGLIYFLVYIYVPLAGYVVAFQNYSPFRGFWESPWVGPRNFERLLTDPDIRRVVANTLVLNGMQIVLAFPVPIALALMLNLDRGLAPRQVRATPEHLADFQRALTRQGVELAWPRLDPGGSYNQWATPQPGWSWGEDDGV